MPDLVKELCKAQCYAHRWGIRTFKFKYPIDEKVTEIINFCGYKTDSNIYSSDGQSYIDWRTKSIFGVRVMRSAQFMIHELAHCFQRENPESCEEDMGSMIAFEYYSTRYLRLTQWSNHMRGFGVGIHFGHMGGDWHQLPQSFKSKILTHSSMIAQRHGLLDSRCRPTFKHPDFFKQKHLVPKVTKDTSIVEVT